MKPFSIRAVALAALVATGASAQTTTTPVGLWKTADDNAKKGKALVRISETNGLFSGTIEKIVESDGSKGPVCNACTDERKDKPIVGMTIIRHVRANPADPKTFDGGEVLDPDNGKTYHIRLKLRDDGKALDVRGYLGSPLLGRTQTWTRVE